MIEKPSILVTSLGRTGTEFFARLFADILPDATALHEPDIFQNTGTDNKLASYVRQIRRAGVWRLVVLKALGQWTLVKLSDARFLNRADSKDSLRNLIAQRRDFIAGMPGEVYAEANIGYYGLVDILPAAFVQHRVVYLVRDGRDWVRSHMNWGEFYGKTGIRRWISHNWPSASEMAGDPHAVEWRGFSRFERLCWAWTRLNRFALAGVAQNPDARTFRFEDVFLSQDRDRRLGELIQFATGHLSSRGSPGFDAGDHLQQRTHASTGDFPAWQSWSMEQQQFFKRMCGPLMAELGYEAP